MSRLTVILSLAALVLAAAGCSGGSRYALDDDFVPFDFDFNLFGGVDDHLRSPYATGTGFDLHVRGADEDCTGLSVVSSDETVLRTGTLGADCHVAATASAPGSTQVEIYEDGHRVHSARVEVLTPDHLQLYARGPLLHGLPEPEARADRPQILSEFAATFRVRYLAGERVVNGRGLLSATALDLATVNIDGSSWGGASEWLQILPQEPGTQRIAVRAGDADLGIIEVDSVEPSAIAEVDLSVAQEDGEGTRSGEVLARALDASGRPIYGAPFAWTLDGAGTSGAGDLFGYEVDLSATRTLVVTGEGHSATATVHARSGTVTSSAVVPVGCSATPGAPGVPAAGAALGLVALLLLRRRR